MNRSSILRRILLSPPSLSSYLVPHLGPFLPRTYSAALPSHNYTFTRPSSSVQSITQPSFWTSLIPKPLRKSNRSTTKKPRSKEWNPATFFIFIFLLIGSMSIQMIALRNSFEAFMRRADAKIGLLREVIERIQKGEKVDVEGLLGTGDERREREWEEVLQEIEREDQAWEDSQRRRKPTRERKGFNDGTTKANEQSTKMVEQKIEPDKPRNNAPRGFY